MTKPHVAKDNFDQILVQFLREKQRTESSHLTGQWPRKEPSRGELVKNNPFHPDRQKASALTIEVPRLYSAMAFAMWQYGVVMNVHLTICWRLLGVTNHDWAVELLSRYNHEAAKWLKVGVDDGVERSRASRRASGTSAPHVFVYVHENAQEKGFHSHE